MDNQPWRTVQARATRRKSRTCGFNGADPEVTSATFPPRAARTYLRYVHQNYLTGGQGGHHLVENKSVPKWMRIVPSGLESLHLCSDRSPEQGAFQSRRFQVGGDNLVNPIQKPWHCGEEVWLESLHVL